MPDVAFTEVAPLEGGPFVTAAGRRTGCSASRGRGHCSDWHKGAVRRRSSGEDAGNPWQGLGLCGVFAGECALVGLAGGGAGRVVAADGAAWRPGADGGVVRAARTDPGRGARGRVLATAQLRADPRQRRASRAQRAWCCCWSGEDRAHPRRAGGVADLPAGRARRGRDAHAAGPRRPGRRDPGRCIGGSDGLACSR